MLNRIKELWNKWVRPYARRWIIGIAMVIQMAITVVNAVQTYPNEGVNNFAGIMCMSGFIVLLTITIWSPQSFKMFWMNIAGLASITCGWGLGVVFMFKTFEVVDKWSDKGHVHNLSNMALDMFILLFVVTFLFYLGDMFLTHFMKLRKLKEALPTR